MGLMMDRKGTDQNSHYMTRRLSILEDELQFDLGSDQSDLTKYLNDLSPSIQEAVITDNDERKVLSDQTIQPGMLYDMSSTKRWTSNTQIRRPGTKMPIELPKFLYGLPLSMSPEEKSFLESKGALDIPSSELQIELIRCFIKFVHPFMPILDLRAFLKAVFQTDKSLRPVSLLLYQAVLFAGSAFVDEHLLQANGFANKRQASTAFFQRTRILYDLDYESDRTTSLQALLLMTLWNENLNDDKDMWHWVGISISLAQAMGLHLDMTSSGLNEEQIHLRKRIWWSLYMRDAFMGLALGRPTRIVQGTYQVSMLTQDDFDTRPFPKEIAQALRDDYLMNHKHQLETLSLICVETVKLSVCISQILATQYRATSSQYHPAGPKVTLVPLKSMSGSTDFQNCGSALENWERSLPSQARYPSWNNDEDHPVLFIHRAVLRMKYQTAVSALYRPSALSQNQDGSIPLHTVVSSRHKIQLAANNITDIMMQLDALGLVKYLPTVAVAVLVQAIVMHMFNMTSTSGVIRSASMTQLQQCLQILGQLRENHAAADVAYTVLEAAAKKANISLTPPLPTLEGESLSGISSPVPIEKTESTAQGHPSTGMDIGYTGYLRIPHDPDQSNTSGSLNMDMMDVLNMSTGFDHGQEDSRTEKIDWLDTILIPY